VNKHNYKRVILPLPSVVVPLIILPKRLERHTIDFVTWDVRPLDPFEIARHKNMGMWRYVIRHHQGARILRGQTPREVIRDTAEFFVKRCR
jgi:hypothetical protein